jgi:hypothetical protein
VTVYCGHILAHLYVTREEKKTDSRTTGHDRRYEKRFQLQNYETTKRRKYRTANVRKCETTGVSIYETTKLRTYESTNLQNCESTKLRKVRNYETTNRRNYETTKLRNYESTKVRRYEGTYEITLSSLQLYAFHDTQDLILTDADSRNYRFWDGRLLHEYITYRILSVAP